MHNIKMNYACYSADYSLLLQLHCGFYKNYFKTSFSLLKYFNNTVNELNWNKWIVCFRNKTILSNQLPRNSFREGHVLEDLPEPVTKT